MGKDVERRIHTLLLIIHFGKREISPKHWNQYMIQLSRCLVYPQSKWGRKISILE